jgi:hypothetical protein
MALFPVQQVSKPGWHRVPSHTHDFNNEKDKARFLLSEK